MLVVVLVLALPQMGWRTKDTGHAMGDAVLC